MKGPASYLLALVLTGAAAVAAAEAPVVPPNLDLETSLALALQHNYAIRQARAFYTQNLGAVMTSESGRLPTVTAFGGYTQIDPTLVSVPGSSDNSWQAGIQASQVLYSGGAVSSSIKSSRLSRDAAELGFAEAVQSALLQVRVRWFDVLLAREQVGVQEQSIVLLEEELANARSRVNAGSGSPFEQLRAEVALANGQPGLIRARNAYRVAAVDLMREIGLASDEATADNVVGELHYVPREVPLEAALESAQAKSSGDPPSRGSSRCRGGRRRHRAGGYASDRCCRRRLYRREGSDCCRRLR